MKVKILKKLPYRRGTKKLEVGKIYDVEKTWINPMFKHKTYNIIIDNEIRMVIDSDCEEIKEYLLKQDSTIKTFIDPYVEKTILKGTKVIDENNYIDKDGGIKVKIADGKYKGKEVIFNIKELIEI